MFSGIWAAIAKVHSDKGSQEQNICVTEGLPYATNSQLTINTKFWSRDRHDSHRIYNNDQVYRNT